MTTGRSKPGDSNPLRGREAAIRAVEDALSGRRFVGETLALLRGSGHLEGREAALAMEIALGAVRHALTIEMALGAAARYDQRRVKPVLRAILLTAGFQIIWMDRVPEFAAVDEAVELARRYADERAAGMVNAVLRKLTGALLARRVGVAAWRRSADPRGLGSGVRVSRGGIARTRGR